AANMPDATPGNDNTLAWVSTTEIQPLKQRWTSLTQRHDESQTGIGGGEMAEILLMGFNL
ncbi:hypothetical protein E4U25_007324, partial [Claviceps purpurea]